MTVVSVRSARPSLKYCLTSLFYNHSMTAATPHEIKTQRVLGIVRVSEQGDREHDSFYSPAIQINRIRNECEAREYRLLDVYAEIDVSGGLPLSKRPALRTAVEAIEGGEADILMTSYLDRLCRNRRVQDEVRDRIQAAGGRLITLDLGEITNGTPEQDFSFGVIGDANELQRKQIKVKSAAGQKRAIEAGKLIGPVPPGYLSDGGRLTIDSTKAEVVHQAFERRAGGATFQQVRDFLADHGIERTTTGVRKMLANRTYLGDLHFGKLSNLEAHDPLVERELFAQVQRMTVTAGCKAKSDRLLARQGILRCGNCGTKMVASLTSRGWPFYRCSNGACDRRQTIGAKLVESVVTDAVRDALKDVEGRASAEAGVREAELALEQAQAALDSAASMIEQAGLATEPSFVNKLAELRQARDDAQTHVDQLGGHRAVVSVSAATDWDRLTLDEQRALIRATVHRVTVAPGRGADRVTVHLVGE